MSLRAKDMLALSAGDDHGGAGGNGSPVSNGGKRSPGGSRPPSGAGAGGSVGNGSAGVFGSNGSSSASGILSGIADDTPASADETEVCTSSCVVLPPFPCFCSSAGSLVLTCFVAPR